MVGSQQRDSLLTAYWHIDDIGFPGAGGYSACLCLQGTMRLLSTSYFPVVTGGITNCGLSSGNVYPCEISGLRVNVSSVLCVQCSKWLYVRC